MGWLPRSGFGPLDSFVHAASVEPDRLAAILHGVLLGPVAPTVEQRRAIEMPVLVLAHRADLIHPFSDASALVRELGNGRLLPAHSPFELRVRPDRLTGEIAAFLDEAWSRPSSVATRRPRGNGQVPSLAE